MPDPFNLPIAEFRNLASNIVTKVAAAAASYGVSTSQSTTLSGLFASFDSDYSAVLDPSTRTKPAEEALQTSEDSLKSYLRGIVGIIQKNPDVTNEQRVDLGLPIHQSPTPISPPNTAPVAEIVAMNGWQADVALKAAGSIRRGKPAKVAGANIYSFVGAEPPSDVNLWKFEGETSRARVSVQFDPALPAGTRVYICAAWKSPRLQSGPACAPIGLLLGGGVPETNVG